MKEDKNNKKNDRVSMEIELSEVNPDFVSEDIIVNGNFTCIKRGVEVCVPKYIKDICQESEKIRRGINSPNPQSASHTY